MSILAGILSLAQHVQHSQSYPEDYKPDRCPHCGLAGLWCHGTYLRQANRRGLEFGLDEPILIPRFLCRACHQTCSCLPEAIPPRRWYLWDLQQKVLLLILNACSLNHVATLVRPSRQTLKRWWQHLRSRFDVHSATLRHRDAELGRWIDLESFWHHCLQQMPLSRAMFYLHNDGVSIP